MMYATLILVNPARVLSPITPRVLANAPLAAGAPLAPPAPTIQELGVGFYKTLGWHLSAC